MPSRDPTPVPVPAGAGARAGELARHARTAWRLLLDPRVPIWLKAIPVLGIVYLLSPLDLAPEFLVPVLGPLVVVDDLFVLLLALRVFVRLAPRDAVAEAEGRPAGPVIDAPYRIDDGP